MWTMIQPSTQFPLPQILQRTDCLPPLVPTIPDGILAVRRRQLGDCHTRIAYALGTALSVFAFLASSNLLCLVQGQALVVFFFARVYSGIRQRKSSLCWEASMEILSYDRAAVSTVIAATKVDIADTQVGGSFCCCLCLADNHNEQHWKWIILNLESLFVDHNREIPKLSKTLAKNANLLKLSRPGKQHPSFPKCLKTIQTLL